MDQTLLTVRNSLNFRLENLVHPSGYWIHGFKLEMLKIPAILGYLQCIKVQFSARVEMHEILNSDFLSSVRVL